MCYMYIQTTHLLRSGVYIITYLEFRLYIHEYVFFTSKSRFERSKWKGKNVKL